ncbi:MAG: LysM peptidoglycan-binding domain-containing protein [Phaeodactylibacter sp.]|nr:LysM peptidoglycan-binding domain-containing protein [Phaeodactylibacter sp.]MCB9050680.1 LysM peptidoglycan-binding domain-containing protein [Lewinellaceae bacterium]
MKKIVLAIFSTLLFSAVAHTASLYILYDPSCMDRLEYVALNGDNKNDYVVYHVNTSPGVKVVLEVGTESTTPQDFPPAQVIKCNNAVFDEKLVNAINSNIERVFMVVRKGENRYFISPITFAARFLRANDYILYDSPKYRFQFDTQLGTIGENIAYKNPNTEVYFDGMLENECSGTLLFLQKAEFAGNPHTNIELIPEVGIVEERSGINAADAMRNVLRLEKVNGKKLDRYLRQLCKGITEPDEPEVAAETGGQPVEEFSKTEKQAEPALIPRGEPATPAAPAGQGSAEFHTVKKGETLYRVSKQYNVSVEQLKAWNKKGKSNTILVGEKLRVTPPVAERTPAVEGQIQTLGGPLGYEKVSTPSTQQPAVTALAAKGGGGGVAADNYHIVRPGETVASIALRYGYTEPRFREFNNLGQNEVAKIGMPLKTTDCECPPTPTAPLITTKGQETTAPDYGLTDYNTAEPRISTRYYQSGLPQQPAASTTTSTTTTATSSPAESFYNDDLSRSSARPAPQYDYLNTPLFLDRPSSPPPANTATAASTINPQASTPAVNQGRQYSPEGDFYSITGQRIDSGNTTSTAAATGKGIISSSFSSRAPVGGGVVQEYENRPQATNQPRNFYVVQEGDTLFSIARRYSMTVERLREINNLGSNEVIIPYQKIYLN